MSYMTAGKLQAFEALMKEVPGHNTMTADAKEYARSAGRAASIVPTGNIRPVSSRNAPIPR